MSEVNEEEHPFVEVLRKLQEERKKDLLTYVHEGQKGSEFDRPMKEGQMLRGSGIHEFCPRREVLKIKDNITIERKISDKLRRIFSVGRVYEKYVRDRVLGDRKIVVGKWECIACGYIAPEVDGKPRYPKPDVCGECGSKKLFDAYEQNKDVHYGLSLELFRYVEEELEDKIAGINGHNDGFLYWNQDYAILEVKTANDRRFKEAKRSGGFESHKAQVQSYMKMTGYKKSVLWYYNKNTSDEHLVYIDYDPSYAGFLFNKGFQMKDFWRDGTIPDRKLCPNDQCPRAKDCELVELCFSDKYPPTPEHLK